MMYIFPPQFCEVHSQCYKSNMSECTVYKYMYSSIYKICYKRCAALCTVDGSRNSVQETFSYVFPNQR